MNTLIDFTTRLFRMIPTFIQWLLIFLNFLLF
jgi:hypothetical protein